MKRQRQFEKDWLILTHFGGLNSYKDAEDALIELLEINKFVHENFHRQAIGKRLIHRYERECKKGGYQKIVLRSQIFAVPFYLACGYKKTTGIRNKYGLKIQPMKKQLLVG